MQGAEWNSELETRPHGNHFAFAKGIASRDRAREGSIRCFSSSGGMGGGNSSERQCSQEPPIQYLKRLKSQCCIVYR